MTPPAPRYLYRYDLIAAREAQVCTHPRVHVYCVAAEVSDLTHVPLADCWLFESECIAVLPAYVQLLGPAVLSYTRKT